MIISYKIILLGEPGTGKTSLRQSYLGKGFKKQYLQTIGADFSVSMQKINGNTVAAQLWDLAGAIGFKVMRPIFMTGAKAAILVFDLTNEYTLEVIDQWIAEVDKLDPNLPKLLIGNKSDLEYNQEIIEKATALVATIPSMLDFVITSALTGENVHHSFLKLIEYVYKVHTEALADVN